MAKSNFISILNPRVAISFAYKFATLYLDQNGDCREIALDPLRVINALKILAESRDELGEGFLLVGVHVFAELALMSGSDSEIRTRRRLATSCGAIGDRGRCRHVPRRETNAGTLGTVPQMLGGGKGVRPQ